MKKILVPIDFSETSENAFVYALEMAKLYDAELLLLHTFDLPYVDNQVVAFNYAEVYESLETINSDQFDDELKKLNAIAKNQKGGKVVTRHIMMAGDLIENIKQVVEEQAMDFVVIGTNGASGWLDNLIGTNTTAVISDVSVPVMSVAQGTKFEKIETIAFTTRYRDKDIIALEEVLAIANKMKAQVKCLYVQTSNSDVDSDTFSIWESHFKYQKDLEFYIIPSDEVNDTIEEFLDNHAVNLLAMVAYKHNFFTNLFANSTTQKMALHLKTPVLALHE